MTRAIRAVHVNMAVHAILLGAPGRTTEVHPAMGAVDAELERFAAGIEGFTVPAPAFDEAVRASGDPFVVAHGTNIVPCASVVYF